MPLNVFLLGRPGSGKSSIARHIYLSLQKNGWYVKHLYDYKLLQERFLREIDDNVPLQRRQFKPRGPEAMQGFDVLDLSVLDMVLEDIATAVITITNNQSSQENSLILIEFARKDYWRSLSLFGYALLHHAHIIYIESSFEDCMKRIDQRIDGRSEYGHYVSNEIMRQYYFTDDWSDGRCQQYLKGLEESGVYTHLHQITNNGSEQELMREVDEFIKLHLLGETDTETIPVVQNTEAIPIISPKPCQIESAK
jgi:hypothetical protein